jgi:hypothetical protein
MPDKAVIFREEIIAGSEVQFRDQIPICNRCQGQNLLLNGNMSFPSKEVVEAGKVISQETDWEYQNAFELMKFECLTCGIRYIINTDENIRLQKDIHSMRQRIRELTGKDPYGAPKPC